MPIATEWDRKGSGNRLGREVTMRGLGIFNVCYGTVGLLSCAVVLLLEERFPREALVAGGLASAWMVASGVAMIVWGRRFTAFLWRTTVGILAKGRSLLSRGRRPKTTGSVASKDVEA